MTCVLGTVTVTNTGVANSKPAHSRADAEQVIGPLSIVLKGPIPPLPKLGA